MSVPSADFCKHFFLFPKKNEVFSEIYFLQ